MKKLMKFLDKLSRDEMRTIMGGYDSVCYATCYGDGTVSCDDECGVSRGCFSSCMEQVDIWCSGYCPAGV